MRLLLVTVCLAWSVPTSADAADQAKIVLDETPAGALAFSPDGTWLAIGADYNGPLKLWKVGGTAPPELVENVKALYSTVEFSRDGKQLLAARISLDPAENVISIWDAARKKRAAENKNGALWAAFTPDGKYVAMGKFNSIDMIDAKTGTRVSQVKVQNNANVSAGAFAANGKLLATAGGEEKQLKLWEPKSAKLLRTIPLDGVCGSLSVSSDAKRIAVAIGQKLFMFDTNSGKQLWSSSEHTDQIMRVCFAADGKELATASHDRTVRRWQSDTGQLIAMIEPDFGTVQTVAYSPDQRTMAVGTSGRVAIYELQDSAEGTDSATTPARTESGELVKYIMRAVEWKKGDKRKPVVTSSQGIAFLSGVAGNFGGLEDSFELTVGQDGAWSLNGKSTDFISARATAMTKLAPIRFAPQTTRYEWSAGKPEVKMLHQNEGICLLSGFGGAFRGYGEEVRVRLAEDGHWYLTGKSQQGGTRATAIGLKWNKGSNWTCSASTVQWTNPQQSVKVGNPEEGLCVMSGISGNLLGGGEGGEVVLEEDDWMLRGTSQQQELRFEATLIKFHKVQP